MSAHDAMNDGQFDTGMRWNATNSRKDLREAVSPAADFETPGVSATLGFGNDTRPDLRTTDPQLVAFPGQMGARGAVNKAVWSVRRWGMGIGREAAYLQSKGMNPNHVYGARGDRKMVPAQHLYRLPKDTVKGWS